MRNFWLFCMIAAICLGISLAFIFILPGHSETSLTKNPALTGSPILSQQQSVPKELVRNGGFERAYGAGGLSSGWIDNSSWAPVEVLYGKEETDPHSGKYSQLMEVRDYRGGAAQLTSPGIAVTENKKYRLSIWMRGSVQGPIELIVRQAEHPYMTYLSKSFKVNEEWREYTIEDVVEDSDSSAMILIRVASKGKLWVDDISFTEIGDAKSFTALTPPNAIIPPEFFGIHIHRTPGAFPGEVATPWPDEIPFKARRLWDSGVSWNSLEPEKGEWNFTILDNCVDDANKRGVELLLPLGLSPSWASARPNEISAYDDAGASKGRGFAAEPSSLEDWRNYVRTVAQRYKGKIRYYEIWNEPNNNVPPFAFFTGSPQKLAELTKEASKVLKEVDPENRVVSSAVVMNPDYLDAYFAAGGAKFADIIGYHFYTGLGAEDPSMSAPERMLRETAKVRDVMLKYGEDKKPLWDTESGWNIQSATRPDKIKGFVPMSLAGDYLARSYILHWALGIEHFYHYMWDSNDMGLLEKGNVSKAIVNSHYRPIFDWLVGAKMIECGSRDRRTWICAIERKGAKKYIVWNTRGPEIFRVPEEWQVSTSKLIGNDVNRPIGQERSVTVGTSPTLFE